MSDSAKLHGSGPDLTEVVTAVFKAWRHHRIPFVVLRNYENLPRFTGHDVDVLVSARQLKLAERLLVAAARTAGYRLSNRAEFATVSFFFFHPETLVQIQFDLFTSLTWRGLSLLEGKTVLDWRIEGELFAIPHPVHEAVNDLLTRLIYHGYVKPSYKPIIHGVFERYPQEGETVLRRLFGDTTGKIIARSILQQDWAAVERMTQRMRIELTWRRLIFRPRQTLTNCFADLRRFLTRVRRPPGAKIVLLGADGSGKSSAADRLRDALHGTFYKDKSIHVHWKPAVFLRQRRANRPPTTNPHARPPRGRWASQLVLTYHWAEFLVGSCLQFFPVLFRAGMVLIERHHYDFIADPHRYRLQPPCGLIRLAFRWLRKPERVFLLDAPAEVLHARKPELTLEETRRRRDAYRELVMQLPQGRIIDATRPLDEVVQTLVREVLLCLAERQARRSGQD
jgi:thymidylate kinase